MKSWCLSFVNLGNSGISLEFWILMIVRMDQSADLTIDHHDATQTTKPLIIKIKTNLKQPFYYLLIIQSLTLFLYSPDRNRVNKFLAFEFIIF